MDEQQQDPIDDNEDIDTPESDEDVSVAEIDTSEDEVDADPTDMPSNDEHEIDAALAAVSQLSLLADDPVDEDDEISDADYQDLDENGDTSQTVVEIVDDFEQPHHISMRRGQLSSVLPALVLIIVGGWLTFTLTTSDASPTPSLLFAVVLIGIGCVFLSQWLTSARWSRGNFFFGLATLLIGGIQLYLSQLSPNTVSNGWVFWIIAIGIALIGAGYVALPRIPRLSIMGVLTIITGAIGYVITSGMIEPAVLDFISNLWIVGVVILGVMILAPLLRRR